MTTGKARRLVAAENSFEQLFVTQFVPMRQFARLLGSDDPENTAQEAFVRVHRRWDRLREPGKALAYLRRTVANLATSRLRHLRVTRKHPEASPADVASAETSVLADPRYGALWRGIEGLPRRQRQVVVLRYWLDLDVAAVAAVLGVAPGTVKATTAQALAKLRAGVEA
jgi:RNA polymerase sigma-70 factor (sigma-E family)